MEVASRRSDEVKCSVFVDCVCSDIVCMYWDIAVYGFSLGAFVWQPVRPSRFRAKLGNMNFFDCNIVRGDLLGILDGSSLHFKRDCASVRLYVNENFNESLGEQFRKSFLQAVSLKTLAWLGKCVLVSIRGSVSLHDRPSA